MKLKTVFLSIVMIIALLATVFIPTNTYANNVMYFGVYEIRTKDDPNMGYGIMNPSTASTDAAKIWNVVKYESEEYANPTEADIYCVKAGVGFSNTHKRAKYDVSIDMKNGRQRIIDQHNNVLNTIVNGTIPYKDGNISKYNALLALSDMLYLPYDSNTTQSDKESLLKSAGINLTDSYIMTDSDIIAVQQAAIWYFTNYYKQDTTADEYKETTEHNMKYDKTADDDAHWLNYTTDGNNYYTLSDYNKATREGEYRNDQAETLYKYLIETAKANANNYSAPEQGGESTETTTAPAKLETSKLNYTMRNGKYIVGPIRINEAEGNTMPYDIEFDVNKTFKFDDGQNELDAGTTAKDLVGNDFYISVSDIDDIQVSVDIQYANNKLTLWASSTNNLEQPVMIPEKHKESNPITLTLESKTFDLALRKYITKITSNGVTRVLSDSVDTTRVPNISESTLTSDTTATYMHRKNPVSVETGDIVTYKISIYNEGEKAGRATQVIDQLPTGLKFKRVVSGNFDADSSYNYEDDNKLILNRKSNNTTNLPAYEIDNFKNGTGYETIEIECEVTATPDSRNQKILTNVAWISREYDAETQTEIYNQDGLDRDSKPATHPNVDKDSMSNYKGKSTNKSTLDDKDYHYEGEQDDDDFEKLVINPKEFDLRLKKYISAINGDASKGKTITGKNTTRLANKTSTDAEFELSKNVVAVKYGDYVTYTFRVYNEGDINGYVTKLTDNIPLGLQFVQAKGDGNTITIYSYSAEDGITSEDKEVDSETYNLINGNNAQWTIDTEGASVKTDTYDGDTTPSISLDVEGYLGENKLLNAYKASEDINKDGSTLDFVDLTVVLRVSEKAELNKVLRNEAAITGHKDENGNTTIEDRDSQPENWPGKDDHTKYQDDEDYDNVILKPFDLALRKFIIAVSDNETIEDSEWLKTGGKYTRAPEVDTSKLNTMDSTTGKLITTATYNHPKEPVEVKKGDIVVYMLRVYNEGDIAGYATEIKDHLPSNLEFVDGEFNEEYGWSISEDGRTVTTTYLENQKISAAKWIPQMSGGLGQETGGGYELTYKEVPIMCKVKNTAKVDEKITNIADITEFKDENKQTVVDRDSQEDNVNATEGNKPEYKDTEINRGDTYIPGQQDDDDFEKVVVPAKVDLALTKFITAISEDDKIEDGEYLSKDKTSKDAGSATNPYDRQTKVDTRELRDNDECHDATYIQDKTPLVVGINSYVLYNIRVYNEGEVDVYAGEVTDFLPENLEFVEGEFNSRYGWTANGRTVKTSNLSSKNGADKILRSFDKENDDGNGSGLDYKDLPILCKVNSKTPSGIKLINTAEITKYEDKDGNNLPEDIDSTPDNVNPKNKEQRQEDDDDYEVILVKKVDIALTKFITAISKDTNIEDGEYLTKDTTSKNAGSAENPYDRQTAVDTKELRDNDECHDATYIQDKTPIIVGRDSYVLYNIRVYNEGSEDLYAGEVTDFLPENLEFVDGEFNKQYGWTAEGRTVKTLYLSSKNGEDKILKAFDKRADDGKGSGLDYKDLPILCKVNSNTPANKELINTAEITKYEDEDGKDLPKDIDSIPNNVVTKNDKDREEDDDDYEVVVVKEFDLALRKWVTQAIVIDSNGQTVTETGHQPYDDPEQVVKVELHRRKLNEVTVKFRYSIRVINEGDIAGYAKEVTDYIPQGLRFVAEDNPGWTDEGNNVISTTLLENTLLQPGEFADVEVLLTWVNNENNMGVMVNTAEISKDYNEYGVPDRDSIPDNKKPGEDDIDDAPVMLSISTGQVRIYFVLGFVVLITIAGGVVLIKKYVL